MTTNVVSRKPSTPPGQAIFNYYPNHPRRFLSNTPPSGPVWDDVEPRFAQSLALKAHKDHIHTPPQTADTTIVMLNTQNHVNGYVRCQVPPPIGYDYQNYDIHNVSKNTNATTSDAIYRLDFNATVDIILQNANSMSNNTSETHPWHLHGHDFWVLGYGKGKFDK
ncbi:hypothetical protein GH714_018892 [Hevea brasiliensis]|uniref:Plastocyanin-like domain-containing protein n=1 Tax=Hevea brasiliensis TaxID=3981 RepID=A0A6A6K6P2_HEVBR|nr:hypothetical protein GH714_018892 [Hevea brasiliensis]